MSALLFGSSASPDGTLEKQIHDAFVPWVIRRIPHMQRAGVDSFGPCGVFVVVDKPDLQNGRPLAAVVFHNHVPGYRSIEASVASVSRMWAKPAHISALLRYAFVTNGCERLQAATAKRGRAAKHVQKFLRNLGFKYEGAGRKAFGSDDALMFSMLRDEAARWLGAEHG